VSSPLEGGPLPPAEVSEEHRAPRTPAASIYDELPIRELMDACAHVDDCLQRILPSRRRNTRAALAARVFGALVLDAAETMAGGLSG